MLYREMTHERLRALAIEAAEPDANGMLKRGNSALVAAGFSLRAGIEPSWELVARDADYCDEMVDVPCVGKE